MINTQKSVPEYNIGEIVKARDRLWRIDQIHQKEKDNSFYFTYSVSNITGQACSQLLIPHIENIENAVLPKPSSDTIGSSVYQDMLLKALKLDLIYGTTSFISLQNSKVIPISYQMVPVLMALNLKKVRLLLADDVGLGKTIEAGLIFQELLGRKKINRVLIVTPANLREQWQTILSRLFGINTVIMSRRNRRLLESELLVGGNPWGYYNFIIVSIDYAKRPDIKDEILLFEWDLIIIDEAHNVMKPHLGTEDERAQSFKQSYGFARKLANKYPNLLLLTATPHNGYKDSFASLLEMINPKIVSYNDSEEITINRDVAINYICQRRRKDVEDWIKTSSNKNPFPERDSDEIYITPSDVFYETFNAINKFASHVIQRSGHKITEERKLNYWTILHFHKRAISSPNALICSVNHRLNEIEEKISRKYFQIDDYSSFLSVEEAAQSVMDGFETDRLTEEERDLRTDKLVLTNTLEDLKTEKKLLINVKKLAKQLEEKDAKIIQLIEDILPRRFKISKKIIIFTRYIDTLIYIKKNLKKAKGTTLKYKDIEIYSIHGKMASQRRQDTYNAFLKEEKGILITTDCMAEGIDLQFSSDQIINYELTWNPNRLEQRNGRIDRFGQPKPKVYIRTLILKDSLEMDILETLVRKAKEIKKAFGFVPGFFGDPESVIDHIMKHRRKKAKQKGIQTTLDRFFDFSDRVIDDLVSLFFSEKNVESIVKDSFYGQNNINLEEIERRMRLSEESIGNPQILLKFLKDTVNLFEGQVNSTREHSEIYEITLPKSIKKEIGVKFDDRYLITSNNEISAASHEIEGINLKDPLVSGLVEKAKNEAFSAKHKFYGRTAAYLNDRALTVSVIYHVKIRYVVNTDPKSVMEVIAVLGIDLFNKIRLDSNTTRTLWESERKNHEKKDVEVRRHLKKALELKELNDFFKEVSNEKLDIIVKERRKMVEELKKQGLTTDLESIDDIDVAGVDLLTVTLIYPPLGSE